MTETMTAAEYQRLYGGKAKPHVPTKQKNGNGDKAKLPNRKAELKNKT